MTVDHPVQCIEFGAVGFTHAAWSGPFYPPDLPGEWRLDFYANELQAVLMPPSEWLEPPLAELTEWVDATERLRVYCLVEPAALASGDVAQRADRLAGALVAWVLSEAAAPALHPGVAHIPVLGPCAPPSWAAQAPGLVLDAAGALAIWRPPPGPTMPAMRGAIEALQAHGSLPRRLFVAGDPAPDPVFLREGRLLLELMGIAPRCDDRDTSGPG